MTTTLVRMETKKLNEKIFSLANDIIDLHEKASKILAKSDLEGATEVINDSKINDAKYLDIEADLEFLITKAPVDKDLRRTLGYLSIGKELKRISDYAKHLAKYVIYNAGKTQKSSVSIILEMHKSLMTLLVDLPKLLKSEDFEFAIELAKRDKKVDAKMIELREKIIQSTIKKSDIKTIEDSLFALTTIGRLERAGDHAVKICEMIIYINNGQHVFLD